MEYNLSSYKNKLTPVAKSFICRKEVGCCSVRLLRGGYVGGRGSAGVMSARRMVRALSARPLNSFIQPWLCHALDSEGPFSAHVSVLFLT